MFNREKTKTTLFLLPLLTYNTGEDAKSILWDMGLFKNSYIKIDTGDYKSPDNVICLHYNWNVGKITFDQYEEILKKNLKNYK